MSAAVAASTGRLTAQQQEIVLSAGPTVAALVARLRRMFAHAAREDLEQTVWEGFARAVPRYDPSQGSFATFGYQHALGLAIDRFSRDARQSPRRLARAAIGDAFDAVAVSEDPFVDDQEILAPVQNACHEAVFRMFFGATFDAWRAQGEQGMVDYVTRTRAFEALRAAFSTLADDDWRVLAMYYVDCATWAEVGAAVGVGEKQAQRRAEKARERLKRELSARGVKAAPPAA